MAKWLALAYKLPPEPSAPRVATWRALKKIEGRYLADGVYVVASTRANDLALRQLAHDVRNYGGEAVVLDVSEADDERLLRPEPVGDEPPRAKPKRAKKR